MKKIRLSQDKVWQIARGCVANAVKYEDHVEYDLETSCIIEGATGNYFYFNIDKINKFRPQIKQLLLQLPKAILQNGGPFIETGFDNNGDDWGEAQDMELLLALGTAAGYARPAVPKEMWTVFENGLPWFIFMNLDDSENK